jgi:hypothetical protein
MRATRRDINFCLLSILLLNIAFWAGSRQFFAKWAGVPPPPARAGAVSMTLGDTELAFRAGALTLQHLGDGGGQVTPLKDYDYKKVGQWLDLLDSLDPASEHPPLVAAFYFGALRDKPQSTAVLVDYLARVGDSPVGEKWRWLAEAAFLARHRMNDMNRALDVAYTLSRLRLDGGRELPAWAREYPAFILKAEGDKASARKLMEAMLETEENPNEVRFIQDFLIRQLGTDPAEVEAVMRKRTAKPR